MHILEKYVDAMNSSDVNRVSALFTEDCVFDDAGGEPFGMGGLYFEGHKKLEKGLAAVFAKAKPKLEMGSIEDDVLTYNVQIAGLVLPCKGSAVVKDGLIQRYTVRSTKA